MKREILFRGKSIQNGKWLYGNIQIPEAPYDEYLMWDSGWQMQVDANTVGQYTGLKDAKGKEIYEGDIIESKRGVRHFIKYKETSASFVGIRGVDSMGEEEECGLMQSWINEFGKVVVGNVFDFNKK